MARLLDALRAVRPHRHEGRLRRRGVRRLRRAPRRRAREQLPDAAGARARAVDHDDRRGGDRRDACTRCSRRFSSTAARSAASARRAWSSPRYELLVAQPETRPRRTSASRSPATCAAAPATCGSSRRCCDACRAPRALVLIPLARPTTELVHRPRRWRRRSTISRAILRARPFAGGTDLMVVLEAGQLPPGRYVSLQNCRELLGIEETPTAAAVCGRRADDLYARSGTPRVLAARVSDAGVPRPRDRRPRDAEPRHDRRQHRQRVARGRHAAGAARLRRGARAGLRGRARAAFRTPRFHRGYKKMDLAPARLIARIHLPLPDACSSAATGGTTTTARSARAGRRRSRRSASPESIVLDGELVQGRADRARQRRADGRPRHADGRRAPRPDARRRMRSRPPSGAARDRDRADRRHPVDGALSGARRRQSAARVSSAIRSLPRRSRTCPVPAYLIRCVSISSRTAASTSRDRAARRPSTASYRCSSRAARPYGWDDEDDRWEMKPF